MWSTVSVDCISGEINSYIKSYIKKRWLHGVQIIITGHSFSQVQNRERLSLRPKHELLHEFKVYKHPPDFNFGNKVLKMLCYNYLVSLNTDFNYYA